MLSPAQRTRRARHMLFWRVINPLNRALVPVAPWWVVLETTGRRSGQARHTPLARGPMDGDAMWLIAVHGRTADWVRNLEANPSVRLRLRGRWHDAQASVHPFDDAIARRFNAYAGAGPRVMGIEPVLVRVDLQDAHTGHLSPEERKRRVSGAVERRLVNPVVRRLVFAGKLGSTYAVLETTGRRTGVPRRIPVANGLQGETFWLISAHGPHARYFQNLLANPRVRIGLVQDGELRWRSGTAHPLYDDDARRRHRELGKGRLGYWLDGLILRSTATQMTTVRIDLEQGANFAGRSLRASAPRAPTRS